MIKRALRFVYNDKNSITIDHVLLFTIIWVFNIQACWSFLISKTTHFVLSNTSSSFEMNPFRIKSTYAIRNTIESISQHYCFRTVVLHEELGILIYLFIIRLGKRICWKKVRKLGLLIRSEEELHFTKTFFFGVILLEAYWNVSTFPLNLTKKIFHL